MLYGLFIHKYFQHAFVIHFGVGWRNKKKRPSTWEEKKKWKHNFRAYFYSNIKCKILCTDGKQTNRWFSFIRYLCTLYECCKMNHHQRLAFLYVRYTYDLRCNVHTVYNTYTLRTHVKTIQCIIIVMHCILLLYIKFNYNVFRFLHAVLFCHYMCFYYIKLLTTQKNWKFYFFFLFETKKKNKTVKGAVGSRSTFAEKYYFIVQCCAGRHIKMNHCIVFD